MEILNPEEVLNKAKVQLMVSDGAIFISTIVTQLEHKLYPEIPTAGTNGTTVLYNPDFFMGLTPKERVGLIAHEAWHIAFNHIQRAGDRNIYIWNMAGDYVINSLLIKNGFTIPRDGLYDPIFANASTEQVYDYLIKENIEVPLNYVMDLIPTNGDTQEKITNIINKACIVTKNSGSFNELPQEIVREVEKLLFPQVSWVDQLYRYLDVTAREDISWRSPNKKYLPSYILPSKYSKTLGNVTIAIDTSGSISQETLDSILGELVYINQTYSPVALTIIDCDCRINNIYSIDAYDDITKLRFTGGGGTSAMPVLTYIENHTTDLLIYFTDGIMRLNLPEPTCPIIWAIYSNPKFIAPFGETIFING